VSYDPEPLTRQIPDTPAGRQLVWLVTMLARDGEGACVADWDRQGPEMLKRFGEGEHTAERMQEAMRQDAERMGQILELGVESASELAIVALVRTAKDRRWAMNVNVEPAPGRLSRRIVPPCSSTKRLVSASPRPVPSAFLV